MKAKEISVFKTEHNLANTGIAAPKNIEYRHENTLLGY